ncbi:MAG: hypothetical protein ACYDHB_13185, partial [Candidatus Dormibacteria bacterium]
MSRARTALACGAGLGALATASYASAVGLARRQPAAGAAEGELEATLDQLLAELGARGTHNYISTGAGRIHALEVGEG